MFIFQLEHKHYCVDDGNLFMYAIGYLYVQQMATVSLFFCDTMTVRFVATSQLCRVYLCRSVARLKLKFDPPLLKIDESRG